ncbi:MAG: hypothetical protein Q9191_006387, partial [Dirinaria sp. TL-2023a]
MHALDKEYKIAEVADDESAYRDFLEAVHPTEKEFSNAHYRVIHKVANYEEQLLEAMKEYRNIIRLSDARKPRSSASNSAFATGSIDDNKPTFQGAKQPPTCICGHKHWYSDCHYLNEEIRTPNWEPDEATQKKVNDALKDDKKRKQVESNIAKTEELKEKKKAKASASASASDSTSAEESANKSMAS